MLKFLPGLIILQIITVCLMLLAPEQLQGLSWLRVIIPMVITVILIAFWFGTLASQMRQEEIAKLKERHALEREKIRVNAERAKHRVTKNAQKLVEKEIRRTSAKANFKVGAAVAAAAGIGGLLLLTQFMTLGIMTLTTAGGVMGGYLLRYRQEKQRPALPKQEKVINLPPEQPKPVPKQT